MNTEKVRHDFDAIARLADGGESGTDRYDSFLLSFVPAKAVEVLDVGCGLGRLTIALAAGDRKVMGVSISPEMIARARHNAAMAPRASFLCGDFLNLDLGSQQFDFVISAATLHHMPEDVAVRRMVELLQPRGRLVINDLRANTGLLDEARSLVALGHDAAGRLLRTGRLRSPRAVREAWEWHGAGETYLTQQAAQALAHRLLPGAQVYYHWLWRYTIVWDKPDTA